MDAAVDKVKERTRRSVDEGGGSSDTSGKRLAGLIPRRKKLEVQRSLSTQSGDSGNGTLSISGNRSETSLPDGSGRSSLLTDDNSDDEG